MASSNDPAARTRDAATIRAAVEVLRRRTRKPKGLVFGGLCGALLDFAEKIDRGER